MILYSHSLSNRWYDGSSDVGPIIQLGSIRLLGYLTSMYLFLRSCIDGRGDELSTPGNFCLST